MGAVGPQGVADRSDALEGGQAHEAAPRGARDASLVGVAALAGWALLATWGAGIDPGDGLGGPGPRGAFLALALGAPLAGVAVVMAWDRAALRSGPARLALGAMAGIVAWTGLSILWAAAPHLAWIDVNRQAIALCALALGIALGALVPRAPLWLGLGVGAAAALPLAAALLGRVLPSWLGSDGELARLSEPVGYWNALALIAVLAAPAALWLAGGARWTWGLPASGAAVAAVVVVVLLTYSRGGLLALAMAVGVTLAFAPHTGRALAALAAGVVGAALPAGFALTDPVLTTDGLTGDLRADAGRALGWRLLVGLGGAAALAPAIAHLLGRRRIDAARARRLGALAAGGAVALAAVVLLAVPAGRDWAGDRVAELRGEGGDAVANDPGRLVDAGGNQRRAWWGEAWRGFLDAPATGQGAGGFALVHLQERRSGDDTLQTREPHGVLMRFLSGTGIVGALLFAALAVAVVWAVVRAATGRAPPEVGLPLAILAAFALQAAVDWSWAVPALTVPALAAAGVTIAAAAPGREPGRRPGGLATGALAAAVLVAVVSATLPWWSSNRVLAGERALGDGRPADAVRLAQQARAADPLAPQPLFLLARAYIDRGQRARALGALQRATELQPDNPATWRALALFLGPDRSSAPAWREVLRLDPRDAEAALRAGR